MGCLTIVHSVDLGCLTTAHTIDKGSLEVQFSMICSVGDSTHEYDNVLFHVNGPLLVQDGYLLVQKS